VHTLLAPPVAHHHFSQTPCAVTARSPSLFSIQPVEESTPRDLFHHVSTTIGRYCSLSGFGPLAWSLIAHSLCGKVHDYAPPSPPTPPPPTSLGRHPQTVNSCTSSASSSSWRRHHVLGQRQRWHLLGGSIVHPQTHPQCTPLQLARPQHLPVYVCMYKGTTSR
jgi:hypothetical protein